MGRLVALSSLALLLAPSEPRGLVSPPSQVAYGAINPDPHAALNDRSICEGDRCLPPPMRSELAAFCRALSSLQEESGADFAEAGGMLHRYCANVASSDEPKFRRINKKNRAFSKLARFPSALECLRAVGFEEHRSEEGVEQLALSGTPDQSLLRDASTTLERVLVGSTLQERWPRELREDVNSTCAGLVFEPDLLDELSAELEQPHVSKLLSHTDNLARVKAQLAMGVYGARQLCEQLQAIRVNTSATAPATEDRMIAIESLEQWYELLMQTEGLVVAYFGAKWCGACKQIEPILSSLSGQQRYRDITFARVDADETPALVGDNQVEAFPTIKFFYNAAEEFLPVVGADVVELERTLDSFLASN